MIPGHQLITPPTRVPVNMKVLADQCGVRPDSCQDLERFAWAAADFYTRETERQLITATYRLSLRAFANPLYLMYSPLISVGTVTYLD